MAGPVAHRSLLAFAGPNATLYRAALQRSIGVAQVRSISQTQATRLEEHRSERRRRPGTTYRIASLRRNSNIAPHFPSSHTSSPPPYPPRRSLPRRIIATVGIAVVCSVLGVAMSAGPAVYTVAKELQASPTDEETLLLVDPRPDDPAHQVNETIVHHPITKALYADPKFIAARPHMKIPPTLRAGNFTGGTLIGEDKMPVPPLVFSTLDGTELVQLQYVGSALCGHPGIVHGGLLATLLDEGLARCCFPGLPNKVAVTASLKLDYRKPCMANQYVVLKAETEKFEGRKAWVKGRLETLPLDGSPGELLVEAEALFIEPRNAAALNISRKYVAGS